MQICLQSSSSINIIIFKHSYVAAWATKSSSPCMYWLYKCMHHISCLTVTPTLVGSLPSISLSMACNASSLLWPLNLFRASSSRAFWNSSYVMTRDDFALKSDAQYITLMYSHAVGQNPILDFKWNVGCSIKIQDIRIQYVFHNFKNVHQEFLGWLMVLGF